VVYVLGCGVAVGLTYLVPVQVAWKTFPDQPGLMSGIVIGGFGLGSLLFNPIAAHICNPNNGQTVMTEVKAGLPMIPLYPDEVSERVPDLMRQLAFSFGSVVLACLLLVRQQAETEDSKGKDSLK
jgi:hypothetical protein